MRMDVSYYPAVFISSLFWATLYKFVCPRLSDHFVPEYRNLSYAKQVEWNSRLNSSFHSVIVSSLSLYALCFDDTIAEDPVWGDSHLVKYNCAVVIGYMIYDCLLILVHYKYMGEIFYFCHHGASVYAFWFVITYGVLPWFSNFRLLAEFSTPFVNQRWFLDVSGYPKKSKLFLINGIAMAAIFFLVRIFVMPQYWWKVYSIYGTEPALRLGRIWHVLTSSCVILDAINLYWMYRIYLGAKKVFKGSQDKSKSVDNRNGLKQA